jgi:hypothetical protein
MDRQAMDTLLVLTSIRTCYRKLLMSQHTTERQRTGTDDMRQGDVMTASTHNQNCRVEVL